MLNTQVEFQIPIQEINDQEDGSYARATDCQFAHWSPFRQRNRILIIWDRIVYYLEELGTNEEAKQIDFIIISLNKVLL